MKYLLSAAGKEALTAMIGRGCLFAFDFDGTLSPTVVLPERARMPTSIGQGFQALCDTAPVAIITGRSVDDITLRLPASPKYLVGNHGAEGIPGHDGNFLGYRAICEGWMHQIMHVLQLERIDPGLMIEHKVYSICMHYRLAHDRTRTAREVEAAVQQLDPAPLIIGGKCGINLLPPSAPNKRLALERLLALEGQRAAFYVGDDETDEIVFRHAPSNWVTARIGRVKDSGAQFFLHHQCEMAECLQLLTKMTRK
ncbi:trehalose-phosphatase [Polaromonas sp.]|uniref:trehalose-phosphatase n=1 Tax=Polaromonas sp. TaxID=1869339 RepID=UPI002FC79924